MELIPSCRELTPEEWRVVEYLEREWEKQYRVTNIEQAMEALGLPPETERRMRLAAFLKTAYVGNEALRERWEGGGPETIMLTNEEKLTARGLLFYLKRSGSMPETREIAQSVDLDRGKVEAALEVLGRLGFLKTSGEPVGYTLAEDHERFLEGLGLTYHLVALENGEKFNVKCAADALILAATVYSEQNVTIDDSCIHCLMQIRIKTEKGKIVGEHPQGIRIFEGDD